MSVVKDLRYCIALEFGLELKLSNCFIMSESCGKLHYLTAFNLFY